MTRRNLLGSLAAAATVPALGPLSPLRRVPQRRTPAPWVDGLSFLDEQPGELARSGLSALILDVSSVAQVETDDGSIRYFRSFEACLRSVAANRQALRERDDAFLATRGEEIARAWEQDRTAVFFQLQGLEPMGQDVWRIDLFHELGVRVMQMTHHNDNPFAGGALEPTLSGLTDLGRDAVARMNELGILPDVSHGSDATALDVVSVSTGPVVLSHGAARALVPHARCAPDEVIRAIAESGGVVGIFMMSFWLTRDPVPSVEHLIAQIRHVVDVGGIEAVGIANDYPVGGHTELKDLGNDNVEGAKAYLPWWRSYRELGVSGFEWDPEHVVIPELNDVDRMFTIAAALESAGFSGRDSELILGANWARVLTETIG